MKKLEKGGISMIDLSTFDKSLKLTWLRRFMLNDPKWKLVINNLYPGLHDFWKYGSIFSYKIAENINNPFWYEVFVYYKELYDHIKINTLEEFLETSFLYHKEICIGNQMVSNRELQTNNIFLIKQLMDGEDFLSHEEFYSRHNIRLGFLSYLSIINSVKQFLSKLEIEENGRKIRYQPALNIIMKNMSGASAIYNNFINVNNISKPKGMEKWKTLLSVEEDDWLGYFSLLKYTTKDSKLRWFQFRILHCILTTNRSVSKYNNDQSHLCTFCNTQSETIQHLLWSCEKVNKFWSDLSSLISQRCGNVHNFSFSERLVLFGQSNFVYTDEVCNLIILMAKYFIYRCKVLKSSIHLKSFIKELHARYNIEKILTKESHEFINKWNPYLNLFKSLL